MLVEHMAEPKKEKLDGLLKNFNEACSCEGSAVVSRDGLLISSLLSSGVDAETFAAMSATMVGAAETALSELKKGSMESIMVESEKSKIIATGAGPAALLVAMTSSKVNLGLLLMEMKKTAEVIAGVLT